MKTHSAALFAAALALSGCGGATVSGTAAATQSTQSFEPPVVLDETARDFPAASPLVIHIGFNHVENTDPTFGPVYYYSPMKTGSALVVKVRHGSHVVFLNDDPSFASHTASGLGPTAFPASFDNSSGVTQHGTIVNGSLTWSTGTLAHGARSQIFTVGPPGHYFFGCHFHYTTAPTTTNGSMGDVIVSI